MTVLSKVFPEGLVNQVTWNTKHDIIAHGEVGISKRILDAGYGIRCSAFPEFYYKQNVPWDIPVGDMRYVKENRAIANAI